MIAISWYLLKVLVVSGILCGYYFIALKDKVFHRWNRFYLLSTVLLSLLLPLVSISIFTGGVAQGGIGRALQTISMQDEIVIEMGRKSALSTNVLLMYGYLLVSLFFIARMIRSLIQIKGIKRRYPNAKVNGINFINTDEKGTPFSFFKDIFWNRSIGLHTTPGQQIFNHEVAHITEKHTYDKIFMNIVLLFIWINPFFWIIHKELNMIHEFVADKMALEDGDTNAFAEMILSSVFTRQKFSITNNFFYSPIKRRLLMLTKNKHAKVNYISRLLVLPLATIIFIGISCKVKTETENQKTPEEIVATAPADDQTTFPGDSAKSDIYNNKRIRSLLVRGNKNETPIELTFEDGTKENISMEDAEKAGLDIPPPPPPPPPPVQTYNGKALKYAVKSNGNKVIINYTDGSRETITLEQAEKAYLNVLDPPKATVKYTPPKIIKDSESKKSEKTPFASPKNNQDSDNKVYTKVEQEATFPGGPTKWHQYISQSISSQIEKFGEKDYGTCIVRFIVDKDGNVSEVFATTMKGTELAKVVTEAVRNGPQWIPATQNNIPVNAYRLQPVTLTNPDK